MVALNGNQVRVLLLLRDLKVGYDGGRNRQVDA